MARAELVLWSRNDYLPDTLLGRAVFDVPAGASTPLPRPLVARSWIDVEAVREDAVDRRGVAARPADFLFGRGALGALEVSCYGFAVP